MCLTLSPGASTIETTGATKEDKQMRYYYKGRTFKHFRQLREYYFSLTGNIPAYFERVKACDGGTIAAYK